MLAFPKVKTSAKSPESTVYLLKRVRRTHFSQHIILINYPQRQGKRIKTTK